MASGSGTKRSWAPSSMNVQELARAIDVRYLKTRAFQEAQPAGVDGGEAHAVSGVAHGREDAPHFLAAQHDREFLLALGTGNVEHTPGATQCLLIEELDTAERYGVCAARDFLDCAQMQQIATDLFFREGVRGCVVETGQLRNRVNVGLDRALGVAAQLEVLDHALAERCHEILSVKG